MAGTKVNGSETTESKQSLEDVKLGEQREESRQYTALLLDFQKAPICHNVDEVHGVLFLLFSGPRKIRIQSREIHPETRKFG